jgi:hypothetical protein
LDYFWYHRAGHPPAVIVRPSDRVRGAKLCIACTQTRLGAPEQKALVREWCDILPTLGDVTQLWLSSKVPQELFDAACRMPNLTGLWIKWSSVKNIVSLECASQLRQLHIGSATSLASIEPLGQLRGLKWLGLENLKLVPDIRVVGALTALEGLTLEGSMWTPWTVETLAPLASLPELKYLSIANLRTKDRTLAPLLALRELEEFISAKWWDDEELAELRRRNPALRKSQVTR